MKSLSHLKEEIKIEIAKGLENAFTRLETMLSHECPRYLDLLQLKGKFEDSQKQFKLGTISYESATLVSNQVRYGLLTEIVARMETEDLQKEYRLAAAGSSRRKLILPFDLKLPKFKMDVLRLDRKDTAAMFRERFKQLGETTVQHYFVYGDRHQQPRSFVERMIFELESTGQTLHYEAEGDKHILVKEPEMEGNLEVSKLRFCECFSERFGTSVSRLSDIESSATTGNNAFITTILKFHVEDWKDYTRAFLIWLLTDFCMSASALPASFLFFHIIQKDSFSGSAKRSPIWFFGGKPAKQKLVEAALKELEQFQSCTVFPELKPISQYDLTKWLQEFISNETAIDTLLNEITGAQKQTQNFDMSFIENRLTQLLQEKRNLAKN